jgi:hypothetical protein
LWGKKNSCSAGDNCRRAGEITNEIYRVMIAHDVNSATTYCIRKVIDEGPVRIRPLQ